MVSGENFVSGAKVYFGNQEATRVMFFSSNLLAAFTPPVLSAGSFSITVTNPDGSSATLDSDGSEKVAHLSGELVNTSGFDTQATQPKGFTYSLPPVVTEINPESGPMAGGTSVTITGENFINGQTKVYIGETQVTTFTVNSNESISAITPASPPGTKNVIVVTPGGTSAATGDNVVTFTYIPAPVISRVSPFRIPLSGGIELDIIGGNFTPVVSEAQSPTVSIGGTSASITFITDTLIIVEAPPGDAGNANVMVTTSDGSSATLTSGVTYISSPIVASINPLSGQTSGGTLLTIRGFNFIAGTTVTIGDVPATDVTLISAKEITARTPANDAGFFDLVVTNPSGEFTKIVLGFRYIAPPTITSVEPAEASVEGGKPLIITGENFDEEASVTIGGEPSTDVRIISSTEITAITPPCPLALLPSCPCSVDLVVTNFDGQTDSIDFTYKVLPPQISSVSPSLISTAGGTTITIRGSSFIEGLTVTIDGNVISDVDFVSNRKIKVQSPSHTPGSVDLQVTNPDSQTGVLAGAITYVDKPFIDKVTPNSGPISGGTLITITGSNFDSDATVKIGGTVAQVSNLAETEITATTPANDEGFHNVVVENPTTGSKATLTNSFKYLAPPQVDSVIPNSCSILGGQLINITGSYFKAGLKVTLDGQVATVTLVSETGITATTPPSEQAGTVDLVVINPDGLSDKIDFTYEVPTPMISGISPSIVSTAGGTSIVIKGAGFIEGLTLTINGNVISDVNFISNNEIRVQSPASEAGSIDLQVINPGEQTGSLAGAITYVDKPFIDKVTPNSGDVSGGTSIVINGSNFDTDATVKISDKSALNVTVVSETEIIATTPPNNEGFHNVEIENPTSGSKVTLTSGFKYLAPPQLDSVTPNTCSILGGQSIRITGSNFKDGATVMIGDKTATDVEIVSPIEIEAKAPLMSAGKYDLTVKNPDGLQSTLVEEFEYIIPAPTINSIAPKDGPTAGGIPITISGMNFFEGATVTIGGNEVSVASPSVPTVTSSSQIIAILPEGAEGAADIVITNPDEQSATLSGGFTYFVKVPGITSITPETGPTTGGIPIAIKGEHFLPGVTVTISGSSALDVNVVSASEIHATIPTGTAGTADVVLTHPDWDSPVTLSDGFTYIAHPPQIDSVEPSIGEVAGGTAISIGGNYFVDGAAVTIGGNPAVDVAFVSATTITAKTPSDSSGDVDVIVTNPDTQSGTLTDGFTYIPLPTVTAVSPDFGPTHGGTRVTITGNDFVEGAIVTIGGNDATDVVVLTTKIFAKTPAGSAGLTDVVVNNPASQSNTLAGGFTYIPTPTVTGIAPQSGPISGGTEVTITGDDFVDGATVRIGGKDATDVVFVSATQITAKTPQGSAGSTNIVVTNPASLSDTLTGGFTYVPPPDVTAISPQSGPVPGGTAITITGENFLSGASVKIGGVAATNVIFVSKTKITAKTPAGSAGNADVVVTNPDAQSDTLTGGFTYILPPTVTAISPQSGPVVGGTEITITGENFQNGATVTIGENPATDVAFASETTITAKTPQGPAGNADVVVTNPDTQSDTLPAAFEYIPPPTVTSISPQSGPVPGGTEITITGGNFLSGATVTFGEILSTDVQTLSGTEIRAITPPFNLQSSIFNLQSVDVVVTNPDSQSGTLADGFTYIPPPAIKSISPSRCSLSGNIEVTINGDNFQDGVTVTIGENVATDVMFVSETKISATIPAGAAGTVDVVVTNPDTQSDTLTNAFTYVPPPDVVGISPPIGPVSGGTKVSITGANFAYGVTVKIGDNKATNVAVHSSTLITVKTPSGVLTAEQAYTVDVIVSHPISESDTLPASFTYIPPPIVTSISPSNGLRTGSTEITITGANFQSGAIVVMGDMSAIDVTVDSPTQISAKTPAGDAGEVILTVKNPDGQSGTYGFTYTNIVYKNIEANREYQFSLVDLTIDIPTGAFTENKTLEFELPTSIPPFLGGLHNLNQIYTLRLTGETNPTFSNPLTLTFNYQEEQLPSNVSEESLRVYFLEDEFWKFIGGTVDTENNTVTIEIDHFSTYSLLGGYAYGDVTGNGEISSFDGALVLQKAVGIIKTLPPEDRPAFRLQTADVSGDGTISAFDATLMLRKAVNLPPYPGYPERMEFPVEVQATPSLRAINTPQAFIKVKEVGEDVQIQLSVDNEHDIIAVDFDWAYDSNALSFISADAISTSEDVHTQINATAGHLNVGIASMDKLDAQNPLLTIRMALAGKPWGKVVTKSTTCELRSITVQLNEIQVPTEIEITEVLPEASQLLQNYPNPFNPETWIPYALESEASVEIQIYNSAGQLIRTLDLGVQPAGVYLSREKAAHWDGRNNYGERVANGVYWYTLKAGGTLRTHRFANKSQPSPKHFSATRKMLICK